MTTRRSIRWALSLLIFGACDGSEDQRGGPVERADGGIGSSDAGPAAGAPAQGGAMKDAGASGAGAGAASGAGTGGMSDPQPDAGPDAGHPDAMMCLEVTQPCANGSECCGELSCDTTTLGQVCCGEQGAPCTTANGEDCCRDLLCIAGRCGYELDDACDPPCTAAPALVLERERLAAIGGSFLGICGDANHTYGYHVAAANLPSSDYSLEGAANQPVCEWHAAAIDIGMDWPASRDWLRWLIAQIQTGGLTGIGEVIGSYDGSDVRYWSDSSGWSTDGEPYTGSGHDTWTHVSIHRSTALQDHGILAGWTATSGP